MPDYDFLPTSDGNGDAVLMHIQSPRTIGVTLIDVDSVVNVPSKFIGTYGTLLPSGFIDPATKADFKGHVSGADLIIDSFEPGSVDDGNTAGQVVTIKPNTGWADRVARFIKNATGFDIPEDVTFADISADSLETTGDTHVGGSSTLDGPIGGDGYDVKTLKNSYKFSVYRSAPHTSSASFAKVNHDTEKFDTGNNFSSGKFTAPVAGFYWFAALAGNTLATATDMGSALYKNGVIELTGDYDKPSTAPNMRLVTGLIELAANDYVEHYFIGGGGSAMFASSNECYFMGFLFSRT